jgi:acetyl-CoA carboxylase carboxyltransferase component
LPWPYDFLCLGVSDYLAEDEHHALYLAREIVRTLNWKKLEPLPPSHLVPKVDPPLYDPDELLGIVSADVKVPFEAREVIARLVDGSRFSEFKALFGTTIVTCWAHIHGFLVGILANNGVIFPDTANKAAQFIEICERRHIPLLYLHNVTGFMVGKKYEHEGIIRHGSKMINAVSNADVPAISIIMGASYGAGNYAMCGRAYHPRFLFAWPNARVAVMGPDQLAGVMVTLQKDAAARSGREMKEEVAEKMLAMFKNKVETESTAYYCTSRVLDDGILDPRQTRDVLGICLSAIYTQKIAPSGRYGIHRM